MSGQTLCLHCRQGYLIAEYSKSEDKTNYFCNNCFKYLETEEKLIQETIEESKDWNGLWTDEELDTILDAIFNKSEN